MDRLVNSLQHYAWGSKTQIADFVGGISSGQPEAELWIGAHPKAPSKLRRDGLEHSLCDVIAAQPERELGAEVVSRYGRELPFLVKLLAAETPLSLQVHPSASQARVGFAREEGLGIDRAAPARSYRDPNAKPELIMAIGGPFHALSGFRDPRATHTLLSALGLHPQVPLLRSLGAGDLHAALTELLTDPTAKERYLPPVLRALPQVRLSGWDQEIHWLNVIAKLYSDDIGVLVAALLNLVVLAPGQTLGLGACHIHAYLQGFGLEVMGNSDNVLRAGLTPKHIDARELLALVDTRVHPASVHTSAHVVGPADAPFVLEVGEAALDTVTQGPEIVMMLEGRAEGIDGPAVRGTSWFVPSGKPLTLRGAGRVARIRTRGRDE